MRKILLHSWNLSNNKIFDPNERDGYKDPYIFLRERLLSLGYRLETSNDHTLEDTDWVLFWDSLSVMPYCGLRGKVRRLKGRLTGKQPLRDLYGECLRAGMEQRIALFLWEAPAVSQANWDPSLHELFQVIFTWNDAFVDERKFHKIHWPQTRQFPNVPEIPFRRKKLLVNISMNKHSSHPRELYSARCATIRHFEQVRPNDFDLYGVGWDRPTRLVQRVLPFSWRQYPSYRGTVRHKWDVLPNYRFSVCYENIRDEPGWITEKIFDSMRAGCVPIYWGAPNITDYVDAEAFVDRRQFKSNKELEDYITGVTESEYDCFQEAMKAYLASERFALFLPPSFADTIIRVLNL